ELDPIEQFWVTVKHKVKRNQLMGFETCYIRINISYSDVPLSHLVNITQCSKIHFGNCLN
ncbi:hypothetical protein BDF21DRAFT_321868, partial [Thamnidium elegans]